MSAVCNQDGNSRFAARVVYLVITLEIAAKAEWDHARGGFRYRHSSLPWDRAARVFAPASRVDMGLLHETVREFSGQKEAGICILTEFAPQ